MGTDDGQTVALPLTQDEARETLQLQHDNAFRVRRVDGEDVALQAACYAVLTAPPEVLAEAVPEDARRGLLLALAAAMGGTYRTGRIGRGMRRKHVIEWPAEGDTDD